MRRSESYIDRYARAVAAQNRYEQIQADIRDAQDRAIELENLAAAERANLAALEETFRVRPPDFGAAGQVLVERFQAEQSARQASAAARASRELTASQRQQVTQPGRAQALQALFELSSDPSVTGPELAQAQELFSGRHGALTQQEADTIAQAAPAERAAALSAAPAEVGAAARGTEAALVGLFQSGPQGIFGGFDGEAEVNERKQRRPPEGSKFMSGEDAFTTYIQLLQDGQADVEEFAQVMGYDSADAAQADFAFAQEQYRNAQAVGAFTNNQRKFFEPRWLESAQAAARLERTAQQARARVPEDPRREALRRELQARGIDPDDPYLQYRGTPMYDVLRGADARFESDPEPTSPEEEQVVSLLRQYQAAGQGWNVNQLEQQLGKTLSGDELQSALSFALAFQRGIDTGRVQAEGFPAPPLEARKPAEPEEAPEPEPEVSPDEFLQRRMLVEDLRARQASIEAELEADTQRRQVEGKPEAPIEQPRIQPPAEAVVEEEVVEERAPVAERATTDPSNPRYSYIENPNGNYTVLVDGVPRGTARKGTRAYQSIASVLSGGQPLAQAPEPEPAQGAPLALPEVRIPRPDQQPAPTGSPLVLPEVQIPRPAQAQAGGDIYAQIEAALDAGDFATVQRLQGQLLGGG